MKVAIPTPAPEEGVDEKNVLRVVRLVNNDMQQTVMPEVLEWIWYVIRETI